MFLVNTMDFNMTIKTEINDIKVEPMDFPDVNNLNSCDYEESIIQNIKNEDSVKYFVYYLPSILYTELICLQRKSNSNIIIF